MPIKLPTLDLKNWQILARFRRYTKFSDVALKLSIDVNIWFPAGHPVYN
jgi:hypothetical protein